MRTKVSEDIISVLSLIAGVENVFPDEPMKKHTSFKAGGSAAALITPSSSKQLIEAVRLLKSEAIPFYIMGNGTNLLVKDGGYDGVIIKICERISRIELNRCDIIAEAGALLSNVSRFAYENGLAGLEFAEGIPGTIGGAVAMNAGAYGGEMKDVLLLAAVTDTDGNVFTLNAAGLNLGYRTSVLGSRGYICLYAVFRLMQGDKAEIKSKMDENRLARTSKQPLELPSAGSTFKRPEGYFAGKLISDAGLRGYRIGGASVSEKHCGFVVNDGNATAADILGLVEHIQKTVYEKFGVMLQPEVKIIGD